MKKHPEIPEEAEISSHPRRGRNHDLFFGFSVLLLLFLAASSFAGGVDSAIKAKNLDECRAVIIVRHAEFDITATHGEKVDATPLSSQRTNRANTLKSVLTEAGVTKCFFSASERTRDTARPLIDQKTGEGSFHSYELAEKQSVEQTLNFTDARVTKGDVVLIVCHSTQIPDLLQAFGVQRENTETFDKMFILFPNFRSSNGTCRSRYGELSK